MARWRSAVLFVLAMAEAGRAAGGDAGAPTPPPRPLDLKLRAPPRGDETDAAGGGPASASGAVSVGAEGYVLKRTADGGYRYDDERFRARIAPDGAVAFSDRRVVDPKIGYGPFTWLLRRDTRKGSREPPQRMSPYRPDPKEAHDVVAQPYSPWRPFYARGLGLFLPGLVTVSGRMDLTDELMRAFSKDDPYRYEKAKFMAATFEIRMQLAVAARRRYLREAVQELPGRLEALWSDPLLSELERRRVLELLREEIDPADPNGRRAAAILDDFARRQGIVGGAAEPRPSR